MGKILQLEEEVRQLKHENENLKKALRSFLMDKYEPVLQKLADYDAGKVNDEIK